MSVVVGSRGSRLAAVVAAVATAVVAAVVGTVPAAAAALPLPAGNALYYADYSGGALHEVTGVSGGTLTVSTVCAGTCPTTPTPTMGGFYDEASDSLYFENQGGTLRSTLFRVPLSGATAGAAVEIGGSGAQDVYNITRGPAGAFGIAAGGGSPMVVSIDLATGALTPIGGLGVAPGGVFYAFTYDRVSGRYYTMERSSGNLYTVDVSTGAATLVGDTGLAGSYSLMADSDGTLWNLSPSSVLTSFTVVGSTIGTPTTRGALSGFATVGMVMKAPAPTYTVTYDGNGSTGGTAPVDASSPYAAGSTVTAASPGTLTRTGYQFRDWLTTPTWEFGVSHSYAPGATFTASANTTLYARWGGGPLEFRSSPAGSAVTSIAFADKANGQSASLTVYVRNVGSMAVPVSNVTGNDSGVSLTGGTCSSGGGSIAAYNGGATPDCTYTFSWTASSSDISYPFAVNYFTSNTVTLTGHVYIPDVTPPTISGPASPAYDAGTLVVAQYSADESVEWSLTGTDASSFSVGSDGTLSWRATPAAGTYAVTVVGTDGAGNPGTRAVTVVVPDVTAPEVAGPAEPPYVPGSLAVGQYTADSPATWTLEGPDAALFAIASDGSLSFRAQPSAASYAVTVVATDAAGNSGRLSVAVTVPSPAAPSRVQVSLGAGRAVVTVQQGASSGIAVTSTLVSVRGTSVTCTVPAGGTSCTLVGLPARSSYLVSAVARGATGSSWPTSVTVTVRTVVVRSAVYFAPLSSRVSAAFQARLRALVAHPPAGARLTEVAVVGYVQRSGSAANDRLLSLARARATASYLRAIGVRAPVSTSGRGVLGVTRWSRAATVTLTYVVTAQSTPLL